MDYQSGKSLLEAMIGSLLTVTVVLAITSVAQQNQKRFAGENSRIEMHQKARTVLVHLTSYLLSAGAVLDNDFPTAPPAVAAIRERVF